MKAAEKSLSEMAEKKAGAGKEGADKENGKTKDGKEAGA